MKNKQLQPLGDRIFVTEPVKVETKTNSGILLSPESKRGELVMADVIAVGPGVYSITGELIPMNVKVGDRVAYRKDMGGDEMKIDGEPIRVFREQDLIAVEKKQ